MTESELSKLSERNKTTDLEGGKARKENRVALKISPKAAAQNMDAHELLNMTRAFDITAAHQSDAFLLDGLGIKPEYYFKDTKRSKNDRKIDEDKVGEILDLCENLEICIEHLKKNCLEQAKTCAQGKGNKIKIQPLEKTDFKGNDEDIPLFPDNGRDNGSNADFWKQCDYFIGELEKRRAASQQLARTNTVTRLLKESKKILKRSFLTDIKKTFRKGYDKYGKNDTNSNEKSYMQAVLVARTQFSEAEKQLSDLKSSLMTASQTAAKLYGDEKESYGDEKEPSIKKTYTKEYEDELKYAKETSAYRVTLSEGKETALKDKLANFADLKSKNPLLQKLPYYDEMVRQYIRCSLLASYHADKKGLDDYDAGQDYYEQTITELSDAASKGSLNALYKRAKDSISEIKKAFDKNVKSLNKRRTTRERKYHKLTEKSKRGDKEAESKLPRVAAELQNCLNGYLTPESDLIQGHLSQDPNEKLRLATQQQVAEQTLDAPTRTEGVMFGSFHTHGRKAGNAVKQTFAHIGLGIAWPFKMLYKYPITYACRFVVWLVHKAHDCYQWCKRQKRGGKDLLPEGGIDKLNLHNRETLSKKYADDLEHYGNFFKLLYCDLFMPHVFIGMINNIFKAAGRGTDFIPDMRWHFGLTGVWNWSDSAMTPIFRLGCIEKETRYFNLRLFDMALQGRFPTEEEVAEHKRNIISAGILDMANAMADGDEWCQPDDLEVKMHLLWVMSGCDDEKLHKLMAAGFSVTNDQVKNLFETFKEKLEFDKNDGEIQFKNKKDSAGKTVYQYIRETIASEVLPIKKNLNKEEKGTLEQQIGDRKIEGFDSQENEVNDKDKDTVDCQINQEIEKFDSQEAADKLQKWENSQKSLEKDCAEKIEKIVTEEADLEGESDLSATQKLRLLQLKMKRISINLRLAMHRYYCAKANDDRLQMCKLNRQISDLQYKKTKLRLDQESMKRICEQSDKNNQKGRENELAGRRKRMPSSGKDLLEKVNQLEERYREKQQEIEGLRQELFKMRDNLNKSQRSSGSSSQSN